MSGSQRGWITHRSAVNETLFERLRRHSMPAQVGIVAGLLVATLVGTSILWIAVTGVTARSQLTSIQNDLSLLRSEISTGDFQSAVETAQSISARAGSAHQLTSGPAWAAGSQMPYLGDPLVTVRGIARAAHDLAVGVLPQLVSISSDLQPNRIQVSKNRFDLRLLGGLPARLTPVIQDARLIGRQVGELPEHTWFKTVDYGRNDLDSTLEDLTQFLTNASTAAGIATTLLGGSGLQRFFVGFLNDAETRGLGGLPGAFGILETNNGKIGFKKFYADNKLLQVSAGITPKKDYTNLYRALTPTEQYLNSTASPNFPDSAKIWAAMWERKNHQHIDGAIALDPTALSYLLQVTGSAQLGTTNVTAQNVVGLTESAAYLRFGSDQGARKQFLVEIAEAVQTSVLNTHRNLLDLLKAAGQAATERRLLMWSSDKTVEKVLAAKPIGGTISETNAPFGQFVLNNYGANKLDYYLSTTFEWKRTGCGAFRTVTATLTMTNTAPASGLTPYVTGRKKGDPKSGDNRTRVDYHATIGATAVSATLNGRKVSLSAGTELQRRVYTYIATLPRGKTRTLAITLSEPASSGRPVVVTQPMIKPMIVSVSVQAC